MYFCENCRQTFENPKQEKEIHLELDSKDEEIFGICPYCHSTFYTDDIVECEVCEKVLVKEEKNDYVCFLNNEIVCNKCLHDYVVEKYGK